MGNPKQKWTAEEEDALKAGIAKHGTGKWKNIQRDPEFYPFLFARSNIDLKDKWRNMSVSSGGQGPREKSRTPKPKVESDSSVPALATAVSPIPISTVSNLRTPAPVAPLKATPVKTNPMVDDSPKAVTIVPVDGKTAPIYNALIFEAIQHLNEPNGVDTSAIVSYIEQKEVVPQNFKRQLNARLTRLVGQDKLEKVQNGYKIKNSSSVETKRPIKPVELRLKNSSSLEIKPPFKPVELRPKPPPRPDTVEEAAKAAACEIAEAENKSFVATEAVKEAERVEKLAEEADSLLHLANEIFEKCSRDECVIMA